MRARPSSEGGRGIKWRTRPRGWLLALNGPRRDLRFRGLPCLLITLTLFLTYIVPSMPWPSHIVAAFDSIPAGGLAGATDEAVLYGALNMLLIHLFPPTDLYVVSPQWKKPPEGFAIDFTTVFVVEIAQHPVFFLEVKPAGCLSSRSGRATADDQMRMQFDELIFPSPPFMASVCWAHISHSMSTRRVTTDSIHPISLATQYMSMIVPLPSDGTRR